MKHMVKFKFEGKEGFLSVVEKDNRYYTLVQKDTPKVIEAQKTKKLSISYEIKNPQFKEVSVSISFDNTLIQWVYNQLEEQKNLYFKTLDDTLCVLEFPKA